MTIINTPLEIVQARGLAGPPGDATQADIDSAIAAVKGAVTSANDTLKKIEDNLALKAALASPALTGNPTAPTQSVGNNSTRLANTAYADRAATNAVADKQFQDALLDAIAGLSPTVSGIVLFTGGAASALTFDTDGTLASNSDVRVASQKALKTYMDALIGANDAMVFKGVIDCSANPNYPAADRGWTYKVSVAGKIGGASGVNVEVGDTLLCITDGTVSGTQAGVGAQWNIVQVNIDGAVVGPASATDDLPAIFDGTTGKLIKSKTYSAFKTLLVLVKGDVGLGNVDNTSDATKNAASVTLTNHALDNSNTVTLKDTLFTLQDDGDAAKQARFQLSGITTGNTRTFTVPNFDATLATLAGTEAHTNKTLDNSNTVTLKDTLFTLQDDGDATKQARFQLSGITTGNTRTLTVPNFDATLATLAGTETLTNKTLGNTNTVTLKDTLFTLQDDGDATKQVVFQLSGITTGNTRTLTVPDASFTLVGASLTQTLSGVNTFSNTTDASAVGTAAVVLSGGLGIAKALFGGSFVDLTSPTDISVRPNLNLACNASAPYGVTLDLNATAISGKDWRLFSTGGSAGEGVGLLIVRNATNSVDALTVSTTGGVKFNSVGTTASAANAFLDNAASNNLLRSTSSRDYKAEIEPLEDKYADAILALRPIWYRSKAPADNPEWGWYGLAAEDVAEIDPRLVHWTYRDDAYETVETVTYTDVPDVEEIEVPVTAIEIVDGQAVVRSGTQIAHRARTATYPAVTADGQPIMIAGEDGEPVQQTITVELTRKQRSVTTERKLKLGAKLVPDGVMYDRIAVLLLSVVQRRLAALSPGDGK